MPSQFLPIAALLVSTFLMLVGGGLSGILLPIRASLEGWSPITIGWIGTTYAVFFTAGCVITPRLVRRVGHVRVYSALVTVLGLSMLLHSLIVHPIAWMVIRGFGGFALAGAYMVVESWLNERVTNENRGKIFSIYMIVSMSGMITGQYILPFGDPALPTLFMIGCILYGLALFPTALSSAQSPRPLTQVSLNLKGLFQNSPAAVVGSFIAGLVSSNWANLGPIYGQMNGLTSTGVATMLACATIGAALFQFPLGRASDKMDRRRVMVFAGIVGVIMSVFMIVVAPGSLWLTLAGIFVFGGVLYPIYSLNVAHANDYAEPEDFVRISSGLLIVYGFGNMAGPQLGGRLMDGVGASGFFIAMAMAYAVYGGFAFWRTLRRSAVDPDVREDFQPIALTRQQTPETLQLDPRIEDVPESDQQKTNEPLPLWGDDPT